MLIAYLDVVVHEAACVGKIRVFGVDVGQLDGHQVVDLNLNKSMNQTSENKLAERSLLSAGPHHFVGDRKSFPE